MPDRPLVRRLDLAPPESAHSHIRRSHTGKGGLDSDQWIMSERMRNGVRELNLQFEIQP
jgi:hypothetical protein